MKDDQRSHSAYKTPFASEELGVYVHIPYCLQKCHYCDFVKFSLDEIPPIEEYFKLLSKELSTVSLDKKVLKTLYFGGGTPSLAPKHLLEKFIKELTNKTPLSENSEITLEINPGTLSLDDMKDLKEIGFNRFSVGIQTFNQKFLTSCGRKHSVSDSLNDLENLNQLNLNFSVDLLFGLPHQTLKDLQLDLKTLCSFKPNHVSSYNLTLPEKHFFNENRPSDDEQIKMVDEINHQLSSYGCKRYEVSNYAVPGFESQHNKSYWEDKEYLGLGMGAHSYLKNSKWGTRTWNTGVFDKYAQCVSSNSRQHQKSEVLLINEALTDFCHTSLRQTRGFSKEMLNNKFKIELPNSLWSELDHLTEKRLLFYKEGHWRLSSTGLNIPNEVFKRLCFLKEDFKDERRK